MTQTSSSDGFWWMLNQFCFTTSHSESSQQQMLLFLAQNQCMCKPLVIGAVCPSDIRSEVRGSSVDSTVTAFLGGGMAPYDTVGENGCLVVSFVTGFLHARSLRQFL